MYCCAAKILTDENDIEDAIHDVFLRIAQNTWETVREIKTETDIRNYLLKATQNTCFNIIKLNKHTDDGDTDVDELCEDGSLCDGNYYTDEFTDYMISQLGYKQIVEAIKSLDDKYKYALYYHTLMDFTVEKTAVLMGQTKSATEKQLVRAKKQLYTILKEKGMIDYAVR